MSNLCVCWKPVFWTSDAWIEEEYLFSWSFLQQKKIYLNEENEGVVPTKIGPLEVT